jgi:hypothetical protein
VCARGFGIEKTLVVQEGIKKVLYAKDSVGIEFYWERFIDGGQASNAPALITGSASSTTHFFARNPGLHKVDSTSKWCPQGKWPRTILFRAPNMAHDYRDALRLKNKS